ncbi:PD-(D/E)XK nuclease domain-containing protein [Pectobacterium versatile]|uniref:PD-(D/E)XK nuclease domain-containing protein n=1 Tax=Pectobacterium versatile TaxID=2488639 RepID=UPI00398C8311
MAHYQTHPDCETLVCFVYDPEGKIANPAGVEHDLEKRTNNINIKVIISPK